MYLKIDKKDKISFYQKKTQFILHFFLFKYLDFMVNFCAKQINLFESNDYIRWHTCLDFKITCCHSKWLFWDSG